PRELAQFPSLRQTLGRRRLEWSTEPRAVRATRIRFDEITQIVASCDRLTDRRVVSHEDVRLDTRLGRASGSYVRGAYSTLANGQSESSQSLTARQSGVSRCAWLSRTHDSVQAS